MKKLLVAFSLLLVLSGCSSDSDTQVGHAIISFKIDGELHQFKNIYVVEEKPSQYDPKTLVSIYGNSVLNTTTYRENFGIMPIRGAALHNSIEVCSLEIINGSEYFVYMQRTGEELTRNFTVNDNSGIVGSFSGRLYNYQSDAYVDITDGIIDIKYDESNYSPDDPYSIF